MLAKNSKHHLILTFLVFIGLLLNSCGPKVPSQSPAKLTAQLNAQQQSPSVLLPHSSLSDIDHNDDVSELKLAYGFDSVAVGLAKDALGAPAPGEIRAERPDLRATFALVAQSRAPERSLRLLEEVSGITPPADDLAGPKYYHTNAIQPGRYVSDVKPEQADRAPVTYLNDERARAEYEVEIRDAKLVYKASGQPVNIGLRDGIFVMDPAGHIYIGKYQRWTFHHSSFLAGRPVAAGGHIQVRDGVLEAFDHHTGHYLLGPDSNMSFLRELEYRGLEAANVKVGIIKGDSLAALTKVYRERNITIPESMSDVGQAERRTLTNEFLSQRALYNKLSSTQVNSPERTRLQADYEASLKSSNALINQQSARRTALEPPKPGTEAYSKQGSWAAFAQVIALSL